MTARLTIDPTGIVRLLDDDGTVIRETPMGEPEWCSGTCPACVTARPGRLARLAQYLRRFFTSWVADDPEPTASTLDRWDGQR